MHVYIKNALMEKDMVHCHSIRGFVMASESYCVCACERLCADGGLNGQNVHSANVRLHLFIIIPQKNKKPSIKRYFY